jgi:hypothetical protein
MPEAMIEGALILLAGILTGRFLPGRRGKLKLTKPPKPVCGCSHHHSFHDRESSRCHATVNGVPIHRDRFGDADAWEQAQCPCRAYSGPEPMPSYYAPEIAGEAGQ